MGSVSDATGVAGAFVTPTQLHDFSPGISEDGLFWTIAVPAEAVGFDPDLQSAYYRQTDLDLLDAHTLVNALAEGPTVPGRVSFDIQWTATGPPVSMRNHLHHFEGEFSESRATIAWSGTTETSRFSSGAAEDSNSLYGFIGRERNGVFVP